MPSIDHNTTMTSSVEVFSTLKPNEDSNESDESLHLRLDEDDEVEAKNDEIDKSAESEEDILNKFDPDYKNKCNKSVENDSKDDDDDDDVDDKNEEKQETEKNPECENEEEKIEEKLDDNETNQEETKIDDEIVEKEDDTKETTNHNTPEDKESSTVFEEATSPTIDEDKNDDKVNEKLEDNNNEKIENKGIDNDTDDLLDVSKIRDAEEDNADDNVSNEECDEDMNDKIDSDEINNEQTINKNDEVDIEENNLEMSGNEDDKTTKESSDETDDKINKDDSDKNDNDKEIHDEEMKDQSTSCQNRNSSKRSLNDSNDENSSDDNLTKRQRLEENLQVITNKLSDDKSNNNNKECERRIVLQSIEVFKEFMKKKDYKITVYDLEELCLQKTSEAIQYCSRLGDTRHQLQIQEQLVETLRKDLQQVTKQARDLEIVNRKLMADLKHYTAALSAKNKSETTTNSSTTSMVPITAAVKPLQPLKITRSVGLQVRFASSFETVNVAAKRRQPVLVAHQKVPVLTLTNNNNNNSNNNNNNNSNNNNNNKNQKSNSTINSPVTPSSSRQQAVIQQTTSPILTQALLSNRRKVLNDNKTSLPVQGIGTRSRNSPGTTTMTTTTNAITTPTVTTTTTNSIIDLTDEDDKQNKRPSTTNTAITTTTTTTTIQNRSIVARNSLPLRQNNQIQTVKTVASNIRLTPSSSTTPTTTTKQVNNTTGSTPTTKHSMYLVQSISPSMLTSTLSGAKVLLNVQSQNGILNGSTVSVIQKSVPSIQLKPAHTLKASNITINTTNNSNNLNNNSSVAIRRLPNQHPAPLPLPPAPINLNKNLKPIPPKPHLSIRKTDTGIILQWKMPYELDMYEVIASYQLFAYQETNASPDTDMWRRVGDVKALALPMACTLTQFADNNKYYFAVRPVDIHKRIGAFSDPEEISL